MIPRLNVCFRSRCARIASKLLIVAAALVFSSGSSVRAAETITAQFLGNPNFNGSLGGSGYSNYAGQTFTAQVSGILSKISYQVADGGQSIPVSFAILDTVGGIPDSVLAEVQLAGSSVPDSYTLYPLDFSSFGVQILAGHQYALTAKPAINTTAYSPGWQFSIGDGYSGGRGLWHTDTVWDPNSTFIESDYDFGFRVTVVPESSPAALLALACACLASFARRGTP